MNGEFKELLEALKEWSAERHHENLKKFDDIFNKLDNLPCGERKGFYESVRNQLLVVWSLLTCIIAAMIGSTFL